MRDITPADVGEYPYVEHTLTFADGGSRKVCVVDREVPFPQGRLIVSRTDTRGVITHANPAFKGLWETIEAGRKWHGYVKNLRKDGACYWVYATVVANVRDGRIVGFTSVRRKPSRRRIEESIALYRTLV